MATNSSRNSEPSSEQSRVSSSSSSQSISYELIPRDDPYFNPNRDIASPRASFPFKKVQGGSQSFQANKNSNDFKRQKQNGIKSTENESKKLIEAIGEMNSSSKIPKKIERQLQQMDKAIIHEQCEARIKKNEKKIAELQIQIQSERTDYQLQKQANQIYTDGFAQIRTLVSKKCGQLEGEGIEQLVEKLQQILKSGSNQFSIIQQQDKKIRELRAQLLKSSQNNINAIFNTEITQSHCLQLQIKKMNGEIMNLKDNLLKATSESQQYFNKMLINNKTNTSQSKKIVKIYQTQREMLQSQSDDDVRKQLGKKRKHQRSQKQRRQSKDSSSSGDQKRSKRLNSTQIKIGDLIQGYKLLRTQYKTLESAIYQLNGSQTNFKELFSNLKKQITISIQNQIKEVNENVKRPSSNTEQIKIAKDLQSKLNHLINTLNAPEKANVERSVDEQFADDWKNVENVRRIAELESKNNRLQKQIKVLKQQKQILQDNVTNISRFYANKNKQAMNELYVQSVQDRKKRSKGDQIEQFLLTSRSDLREQQIMEQMSAAQNNGHVVHTASLNKLHSSQSYHQSNSKNSQLQALHSRLQKYEEMVRQKQLRITQLQNTIMDHFQSRAYGQPHSFNEIAIKEKYELYINNLKMLLSQSRKQNQRLKNQFIKASELGLSRAQYDAIDINSVTLSDRTTKNCIAQTRLIQRRQPKTNSFQSIKGKLEIQSALQKAIMSIIQLAQKIIAYQQVQRLTLGDCVINCLKQLIFEAKQRRSAFYEQTIQGQQIRKRLLALGLQLN